uniref:Uncharacterized protein n=1 Tax=Candidatus Kentrum sp. FW TaxID=2126338 RepID=A0A450TG83_9GAMM|nr:MAG: hypothetical protein BECKFW1821A_GA0114235_111122 [Candidatus Kentron sp. FW]VFJ66171.1 MAG: hypothetical protein BECKFW1821B_GA0114236_111322 [Candidatus Kentron sp. FW]
MFEIEFTPASIEDLKLFKKHEQVEIIDLHGNPASLSTGNGGEEPKTVTAKRDRGLGIAYWKVPGIL